jgi:hypothetical protein
LIINHEEKRVYVRQSWLGDMMICMERGRLAEAKPEFRTGSDATIMGTAVHHGIEQVLAGHIAASEIADVSVFRLGQLKVEEKWRQTNIDPDDMVPQTAYMADAWARDIAPSVPTGGRIEQKFAVPMNRTVLVDERERGTDEYELWFAGTMDYVDPNGVIWDWKTAARKYSQGDKQKQSIQASVYSFAATALGYTDWNVQFNFGVMTRSNKSAGSIVPVMRTPAHADWVAEQAAVMVTSALRMGHNAWPKNDQHNLCSERWCPWWSICKGSYVSDVEQLWSQEAQ